MRDYWFVCVESGQSVRPSVYHLMLISAQTSLNPHWPTEGDGNWDWVLIGWLAQLLLFTAGALVVTGPVPVCKIETFLTLIVMLIVSLPTLTTGAREDPRPSARGELRNTHRVTVAVATTTSNHYMGYRLTRGPGDLRGGQDCSWCLWQLPDW